jgi:hypothetical protein
VLSTAGPAEADTCGANAVDSVEQSVVLNAASVALLPKHMATSLRRE